MRHISHMMCICIYTWFIMDQLAFIIANFSIASFCSARSYQLYIISCHIFTWQLHHLMHLHHVHPPSLGVSFQFPKGIPHVSIRSLTFFSIWMRRVKAMTCGKLPWRHRRNDKGHSVEAKDWAAGIWVSTPYKFGVLAGWRTWIFLGKLFGRPRRILSVNWLSTGMGSTSIHRKFERWEQWKSH